MFKLFDFLKNITLRKNDNSLPKVAVGKHDAIFLVNDSTKLFAYAELTRASSGEEPDYYTVKVTANGFNIRKSTVQEVIYSLGCEDEVPEEQTEEEPEPIDEKEEMKKRYKEMIEKHRDKK